MMAASVARGRARESCRGAAGLLAPSPHAIMNAGGQTSHMTAAIVYWTSALDAAIATMQRMDVRSLMMPVPGGVISTFTMPIAAIVQPIADVCSMRARTINSATNTALA